LQVRKREQLDLGPFGGPRAISVGPAPRAFAALATSGVEVRGKVVLVDSVDLLREEC
ncbi:Crp/Fnr family transcriptional regulator, partial [Rhizobium ruizarguesonis]